MIILFSLLVLGVAIGARASFRVVIVIVLQLRGPLAESLLLTLLSELCVSLLLSLAFHLAGGRLCELLRLGDGVLPQLQYAGVTCLSYLSTR